MPSSKRRQADKVARHRGKEKAGVGKKALWAGLGLLALIAIPVAAIGLFANNLKNTYEDNADILSQSEVFPEEQSRPMEREDEAQTILLLGSDTRAEVDPNALEQGQDSRSDAIMVARIPADRSGIYITSIMRDSWVDIPGYGDNKINAAFAYGGIPLTVATVEQLLDTRIDHVAVIDFEGFKGLTNALGGVTVNNSVAFNAGDYQFNEGEITLNGDQALTFVRARYPFEDGDYQRVRNQQAYMKGLLSGLLSRDTLTSPGKISDAVAAISPFLSVDEGLTAGYIIGLAPGLRDIRSDDVHFVTLPTLGPSWSPDGTQSIILLDNAGMESVRQAFREDTVGDLIGTD